MFKKTIVIGVLLAVSVILLTYCNLPRKETAPIPATTPTTTAITIFDTPQATNIPTQAPTMCDNLYQPSKEGDTWVYSGSNTAVSSYERTDTITRSDSTSFTSQNTISGVTYAVDYTCSEAGIVAENPVQQYLGALLNSPGAQIKVKLNSASGLSLPAVIKPGDQWQQVAVVDAEINRTNMSGRLIFDYSAVGMENITVPAGTYEALRVEVNIQIEISPLRIGAGTYETTLWMAPNVGIIKTQGTSHVPGIDFTDSTQLTSFTPSTQQ